MGNYVSKLFHVNESQKESNEPLQMIAQQATTQDSSMCTPTLLGKKVLVDPRSVSAGITRTPIEVKCTPVGITKVAPSAIPKYLQKQYLETDMDVVMPPLTPKKRTIPKLMDSDQKSDESQDYLTPNTNVVKSTKVITPIDRERYVILGLDPRSPAADFDRTPILMPKSLALIRARSQEILNRRGSYETDIYNPRNREITTSLSIPEIQMLVSEDLKTSDTEQQNELNTASTTQSDSDSNIFESEEEVTVIKNPKYKNEKRKSLISDEQTVIDKEEDKDNTEKQDNCKNIEHAINKIHIKDDDKIEIWHDSLSLEENISGKEDKERLLLGKIQGEDVIIMFDEYITTSTSLSKPMKTGDFQKNSDEGKKKKKNTETDVKLTSNEKKIFTPENKHGVEMRKFFLQNRTPLGNRSNNSQMQRMSLDSPQQLSRNKVACARMQQENTSPCKIYSAKARNGTQWDPNTTVFI